MFGLKSFDHTDFDFVAQSDFDDVFKHEEPEEFCDVSHLLPCKDSFSSSARDLTNQQKGANMLGEMKHAFDSAKIESYISSKRELLFDSIRTKNVHNFGDYEHLLLNANKYVASTTFSDHRSIQDNFDDLQ